MASAIHPSWIAVDWGTTHMRAYAMAADGAVLARTFGPGMGALAADPSNGDFEAALLSAVGDWVLPDPVTVVMCGMVGSRQGWQEAKYLPVPQSLGDLGATLMTVTTQDARIEAWIVPGLSQNNPFDVMRGEESQLAGYAAYKREIGDSGDGLVCLPGTHAKWARIEGGLVVHFATAMTGELFDLLTEKSILAHSVSTDFLDADAFDDAVRETYRDPASLPRALFGVRAEGLLTGEDGARARARVSGLLIGAELAGVDLAPDEVVTLIGSEGLREAYGKALAAIGHEAQGLDGEAMVLQGLSNVYGQMLQNGRLASHG